MKFTVRDTQTDFSVHDISSSKLVHFLRDKKAITDRNITAAISKIADLKINQPLKIKWFIIMRTE